MRRLLIAWALTAVLGAGATAQAVQELESRLETATGEERIRVLLLLARALQINAPSESIGYAQRALERAREISDRHSEIRALITIGVGQYNLGNYPEALEAYLPALAVARELKREDLIADALNNIGIIYYVWGDYDRTLEYYAEVLDIRRRLDDRSGVAASFNNIGNVYHETGRYQQALEQLAEALTLYESLGQRRRVASTLNNIGLAYTGLRRFDEALPRFQRALGIAEELGDKPGMALSLNNIGLALDNQGQGLAALEYYERSLELRRELGDRQGIAVCLNNLGTIEADNGNYVEARRYLDEAMAVAREIGVPELERDICDSFVGLYARTGDSRGALLAHQQFRAVEERLFTERTAKRLAELQARFEVEKKDREIEVLRKTQEIQQIQRNVVLGGSVLLVFVIVLLYRGYRLKDRANREMQRAHAAQALVQAERERAARAELAHVARVAALGELASALAHELNKPLATIMLNAQTTRQLVAAAPADPEVDGALNDIVEGAGRAREIIKRLRSLIRRGEITREKLDINEVVQGIDMIVRPDVEQRGVALELNLTPGLTPVDGDSVQIQQVVLNLVQNAVAAASDSENSAVVVRTSQPESGTILVAVSDNGPGADDETLEKMFDPFFTTKSEGLGLGLSICTTIVQAHGGRLWATRNPEGGTTVQFSLPAVA